MEVDPATEQESGKQVTKKAVHKKTEAQKNALEAAYIGRVSGNWWLILVNGYGDTSCTLAWTDNTPCFARAANQYPDERIRASIAKSIGLNESQVNVWFCHRRRKDRSTQEAKEKPRQPSAGEGQANGKKSSEGTPKRGRGGRVSRGGGRGARSGGRGSKMSTPTKVKDKLTPLEALLADDVRPVVRKMQDSYANTDVVVDLCFVAALRTGWNRVGRLGVLLKQGDGGVQGRLRLLGESGHRITN
eukprot:scaffold302_cov397-Prasinococcus_capsulatus_cf.AAC.2